MANPERKDFEVIPEEATPLTIERKEVISAVPSQFTKQVSDSGKPLIQTPATSQVTVKLPADSPTLTNLSKGSVENAITWFANFWLRMIKKALYFGWKIVNRE